MKTMGTGEVIKQFLVGLGFGVDEASLAKFNKSIASASLRVTALYTTIKVAAAAIVYGISEISEGFEKMGYEYRIIAPAINKALILRRELLRAYSAAGINITKVIQNSVKLNFSLTKTKYALEAIYRSVGSKFFTLITKESDAFRKKLYDNMPKILNVLERMVKFVFKALEATNQLGRTLWSILTRVYDFFVMLDTATDGWSTKVLGLIAAWQLLNLAFVNTPIGRVITGLVALLALYDDLQTFKEGGKSLFDWSDAIPVLDTIKKIFSDMLNAVGDLILAFRQLLHLDFSGFKDVWADLKGAFSGASSLTGKALNAFNGAVGLPTYAQAPLGVGSGANHSQTNQNVRQQTNINVVGSADASRVGQAVAGEQKRVNQDMTRNLKGATR